MKRTKGIIFTLVLAMVTTSFCFVDGNSLDIEGVASKVVKNSPAFLSGTLSAKKAAEQAAEIKGIPAIAHYYAMISSSGSSGLYGAKVTPKLLQYAAVAKQRGVDIAENTIRLQSYSLYINFLKSRYAVDIQKQLVINAEKNYKDSQLRYSKGQISKNDMKLSEQNLSKAKLALQISERRSKGLLMTMNAMTGEPVDKQYDSYIDSNLLPTKEIGTLDEYISLALASRAEVLNAEEYLPILQEGSQIKKVDHPIGSDVFHQETNYDLEKAKLDVEQARISVEVSVVDYYKELENKMSAWQTAEEQYMLAESNYKGAQEKFKLGKLSEAMMNIEKVTYMTAKMNRDNAKLDAFFAQVKMNCISGIGPGK